MGEMNNIQPDRFYDTDIPYATCKGTNYQIGLQHGTVAKNRIHQIIHAYDKLYRETAKIDWNQAKTRALKYKKYLLEVWPEIVEEMQGIADGSGVELIDIVTLNVRSEICLTNYSDGCTSLTQLNNTTNDLYICQNWDWIEGVKSCLVYLDIQQENKPRILTLAEAGIVCKMGMNSAGVGLMLNAIKCGVTKMGLPTHLAVRKCLECTSVEGAIEQLVKFGVASTSNIMLADKSGTFVTVEASPKGLCVISPDALQTVIHTNHLYGTPRFVKDFPAENSFWRFKNCQELRENAPATPESIRSTLSDTLGTPYSICREPNSEARGIEAMVTLTTTIINIRALEGEISIGNPSKSPKRYRIYFN